MKLIKISNLFTLGLALTFAAVGCKTKPTPLTIIPGTRTSPTTDNRRLPPELPPFNSNPQPNDINNRTPSGIGFPDGPGKYDDTWIPDALTLKDQTVYFEYDKSAIRSIEQSKIDAVVAYLKSNPKVAVRVEGNCDERGTEEYNRSLGTRRALSAREQLAQAGIDPNRVDVISYGEDKPAVQGHDAAAWAKNRRDDFVVLTHP